MKFLLQIYYRISETCCYQVFAKDMDKDTVLLYGARASRVENQDAIDACIVGMLSDPKEVIYVQLVHTIQSVQTIYNKNNHL